LTVVVFDANFDVDPVVSTKPYVGSVVLWDVYLEEERAERQQMILEAEIYVDVTCW